MNKRSPIIKKRGIFYFSSTDYFRPEITNYLEKLKKNYEPPNNAKILLLIPENHRGIKNFLIRKEKTCIHVCKYGSPFGVVPLELEDIYPLAQIEKTKITDFQTLKNITESILNYISRNNYEEIVLLNSSETWKNLGHNISSLSEVKKFKFKTIKSINDLE